MTESEQLAQLALSLKDNEAFQEALDRIRNDAVAGLVSIDPDDRNGIIHHQATVSVVDQIRDNLDAFIRSGAAPNPPGIA